MGLCASGRLSLDGLAWLLCSLFFSLRLGDGPNAPGVAERGGPAVSGIRIDAVGRQAAPPMGEREARIALAGLNALVIRTLSQALPFARWRCDEELPSGVADAGARRYRITGPCAALRLTVALLEKLHPAAASDFSALSASTDG